jgi:uncharacterized protein YaaQ
MKLIISIVHRDDADRLLDALVEKGYRATKISTTGGFLRAGNATILVGVEEQKVPGILSLIATNCQTRTELMTPLPSMIGTEPLLPEPVEVVVGGATVFILNVEQFWRF